MLEKRVDELENTVVKLVNLTIAQQETINSLVKCMDHIEDALKNGVKIDQGLYTYCKELRKEINGLKKEA